MIRLDSTGATSTKKIELVITVPGQHERNGKVLAGHIFFIGADIPGTVRVLQRKMIQNLARTDVRISAGGGDDIEFSNYQEPEEEEDLKRRQQQEEEAVEAEEEEERRRREEKKTEDK